MILAVFLLISRGKFIFSHEYPKMRKASVSWTPWLTALTSQLHKTGFGIPHTMLLWAWAQTQNA